MTPAWQAALRRFADLWDRKSREREYNELLRELEDVAEREAAEITALHEGDSECS